MDNHRLMSCLVQVAVPVATGESDVEQALNFALDVPRLARTGQGWVISPAFTFDSETRPGPPSVDDTPDDPRSDAWQALEAELANAQAALAGDSNDAEHEALHGLAEAVARVVGEAGSGA